MKKRTHHLIAEVPRKRGQVELTIGIDLGDVWSHYCTLNQQGEVIDRGRFRTIPKAIDTWFTDVPHARVAMEAGVHSIWISEQLEQLGHEVIVANVRELRAISHSDRKTLTSASSGRLAMQLGRLESDGSNRCFCTMRKSFRDWAFEPLRWSYIGCANVGHGPLDHLLTTLSGLPRSGQYTAIRWCLKSFEGWTSEEVTLKVTDTLAYQPRILFLGFDSFGDKIDSKVAAHLYDGMDDNLPWASTFDVVNKASVDLDLIRLEVGQET